MLTRCKTAWYQRWKIEKREKSLKFFQGHKMLKFRFTSVFKKWYWLVPSLVNMRKKPSHQFKWKHRLWSRLVKKQNLWCGKENDTEKHSTWIFFLFLWVFSAGEKIENFKLVYLLYIILFLSHSQIAFCIAHFVFRILSFGVSNSIPDWFNLSFMKLIYN